MTFMTFVLAWFVSVICMTLFSALWSVVSGCQFREPVLLSKVLQAHPSKTNAAKNSNLLGWVLHFVIGAIFLGCYEVLWELTNVERNLSWSLIFGAFFGLLGIVGWKILFKAVNFSSQFNYVHYFVHLFFAHLVFSISALVVYYWLN